MLDGSLEIQRRAAKGIPRAIYFGRAVEMSSLNSLKKGRNTLGPKRCAGARLRCDIRGRW